MTKGNILQHGRIVYSPAWLLYISYFSSVVIWSDVLGGVHMWSGTLPWNTSHETVQSSLHWRETGQTSKLCLQRWNVRTNYKQLSRSQKINVKQKNNLFVVFVQIFYYQWVLEIWPKREASLLTSCPGGFLSTWGWGWLPGPLPRSCRQEKWWKRSLLILHWTEILRISQAKTHWQFEMCMKHVIS